MRTPPSSLQGPWRRWGLLPGDSGGTAPDSHRTSFTAVVGATQPQPSEGVNRGLSISEQWCRSAKVSPRARGDAGDEYAPLAQLAEQLTLNQRVRGSSPWRRTDTGPRLTPGPDFRFNRTPQGRRPGLGNVATMATTNLAIRRCQWMSG
jgi:hypothetical protein